MVATGSTSVSRLASPIRIPVVQNKSEEFHHPYAATVADRAGQDGQAAAGPGERRHSEHGDGEGDHRGDGIVVRREVADLQEGVARLVDAVERQAQHGCLAYRDARWHPPIGGGPGRMQLATRDADSRKDVPVTALAGLLQDRVEHLLAALGTPLRRVGTQQQPGVALEAALSDVHVHVHVVLGFLASRPGVVSMLITRLAACAIRWASARSAADPSGVRP